MPTYQVMVDFTITVDVEAETKEEAVEEAPAVALGQLSDSDADNVLVLGEDEE